MFRDWLREHPDDRDRYADVKRDVAGRGFTDSMLYNNAKAWFVYDLYEKIFAADPDHEHDPRPRQTDGRAECDFALDGIHECGQPLSPDDLPNTAVSG